MFCWLFSEVMKQNKFMEFLEQFWIKKSNIIQSSSNYSFIQRVEENIPDFENMNFDAYNSYNIFDGVSGYKPLFCVQVTLYFLTPGLLRVHFRCFSEMSLIYTARRINTVKCGVI
jgi:hypothetical protein